MGSTCSISKSKPPKIQSMDQLSYECDEYGVLHPEDVEPSTEKSKLPPPLQLAVIGRPTPATAATTTTAAAAAATAANTTTTAIYKSPPTPFEPDENDVSDTFGWVSAKQFHNYFYEGFYAPFILNPDYMFIIDARPEDAFRTAHILTSQWHGDVPLQNQELDFRRFSIIALYDADGAADENSAVRRIQHHLMKKPGAGLEPMIIRGGIEVIEKQFPYMITRGVTSGGNNDGNGNGDVGVGGSVRHGQIALAFIPWFPAIILDYCLYMGRTEHAVNVKVIKTLSITHVVNLSATTPGIFPFVSYLCVPMPAIGDRSEHSEQSEDADSSEHTKRSKDVNAIGDADRTRTELSSYFTQINAQIAQALGSGGRVLVHCDEGLDPSAAVIIAFLMMSKKCSLADAHDYVKSLRPIIRPNDSKLSELSEYESELYGRKYTNLEDLWV